MRDPIEDLQSYKRHRCMESIFKGIEGLIIQAHGDAVEAGWYKDPETGAPIAETPERCGSRIALMHSELSEALEGVRKDKMDDHLPHRKSEEVELADLVIRVADYCGARRLDLAGAIIEKMEYNRNRADHKLENRAKEGGKRF